MYGIGHSWRAFYGKYIHTFRQNQNICSELKWMFNQVEYTRKGGQPSFLNASHHVIEYTNKETIALRALLLNWLVRATSAPFIIFWEREERRRNHLHTGMRSCLQLSPKNIGNEAKNGDYFSSDGQNSFGRWLTTNDYVPIFRKWPIEHYKQEITSSNLIWLNTLVALLVSNRVVSPCYTITTPFATLLQIVEK